MNYQSGFINFSERAGCRADADHIFIVYGGGQQAVAIGTQLRTPLWRVLCAGQPAALANGNRSGRFLNPALYAIAKPQSYTNCFHDPQRATILGIKPNLFFAVPGLRLATVWNSNGVNHPDNDPCAGITVTRCERASNLGRLKPFPAKGVLSGINTLLGVPRPVCKVVAGTARKNKLGF